MDECDYMFKLVLLGSSGVGKSNILLRFTKGEFSQNFQTTVGVEYATKTVETQNKKRIKFQIWDTAGQEQYRALMKTFYKGASAALLTYDITSQKTFEDLQYWYKQISNSRNNVEQYCKSEIVIMLVGNKSDLDEMRKVSKQDGLSFAQKNRVAFYEVSAKTGSNVDLIFFKIAEQLQKIMMETEKAKQEQIASENKQSAQKKQTETKNQKESTVKITNNNTQKKEKKGSCCSK